MQFTTSSFQFLNNFIIISWGRKAFYCPVSVSVAAHAVVSAQVSALCAPIHSKNASSSEGRNVGHAPRNACHVTCFRLTRLVSFCFVKAQPANRLFVPSCESCQSFLSSVSLVKTKERCRFLRNQTAPNGFSQLHIRPTKRENNADATSRQSLLLIVISPHSLDCPPFSSCSQVPV